MSCPTAVDIVRLNPSDKPTLLLEQWSSILITYIFLNGETPSGFPLTH